MRRTEKENQRTDGNDEENRQRAGDVPVLNDICQQSGGAPIVPGFSSLPGGGLMLPDVFSGA
jgi:hypothetical protein